MQVHFVLVHPARGENVGFAARALKTLGFNSLRIVGNSLQDSTPARKTGYGAHDILDSVRNFTNLNQALFDVDLSIGTTSKGRVKRYDYHTPKQIGALCGRKQKILATTGLVFGSEENGLSTDDLDRCDLVSTIPLSTSYPSLNLAQSVLIYAWELSTHIGCMHLASENPQLNPQAPVAKTQDLLRVQAIEASNSNPTTQNTHPGTGNEYPATRPGISAGNSRLQGLLKEEIKELLNQLGVLDKPLLAQRIMDRVMLLNSNDSELLMMILAKIKRGRWA